MQWRCTRVCKDKWMSGLESSRERVREREADVRGYSREHKHNWPLLYFPKSFFCWNVSAIKTVLSCFSFRSLGRKGEWELHLFGYLTGSSETPNNMTQRQTPLFYLVVISLSESHCETWQRLTLKTLRRWIKTFSFCHDFYFSLRKNNNNILSVL